MKKATPSKEGRRSLPTPAPRPATRAGVFLPYKEGRQTFLVREREREIERETLALGLRRGLAKPATMMRTTSEHAT